MRLLAFLAVLLLAGCGEEKSREPGRSPERTVVAALGDSITAGSPGWDPNPAVRALLGGADERSQYEYWAQRRLPNTRFRNCGINGQRTHEIAPRLDDCARGADVLLVQGGVNDIATGIPIERAAANLRAMVKRGKQLGLGVLIAEVLPWNNGYPLAARPVRRLNRLIGRIGRDEATAVLAWYGTLEDPRRPGRMKPEWTSDGNHPSVEGYRRLGESVELPG